MKPKVRQTPNLILAEGDDEVHLVEAIVAHGSLAKCDVWDAGGKDNIRNEAKAAFNAPGPRIRRIGVVRDAEMSASDQTNSTIGFFETLAESGRIPTDCVPRNAYLVERSGDIATGFAIVPHDKDQGALENLCMRAPAYPKALECTDQMFRCLDENNAAQFKSKITRGKARVQAYLAAAATKPVYHRCGLGARHGLFDLDHECFDTIRDFLSILLDGAR